MPNRPDEWLVPSLLREGVSSPPQGWALPPIGTPRLRLHFHLRASAEAAAAGSEHSASGGGGGPAGVVAYETDELRDGFLPIGAFHRLCAAALGCSQPPSGLEASLDRNHAFVAFDKELVTLTYVPAESSVLVQLHSEKGAAAVADQLRVLVSEHLGELCAATRPTPVPWLITTTPLLVSTPSRPHPLHAATAICG